MQTSNGRPEGKKNGEKAKGIGTQRGRREDPKNEKKKGGERCRKITSTEKAIDRGSMKGKELHGRMQSQIRTVEKGK